jgi:hypothetical protein
LVLFVLEDVLFLTVGSAQVIAFLFVPLECFLLVFFDFVVLLRFCVFIISPLAWVTGKNPACCGALSKKGFFPYDLHMVDY